MMAALIAAALLTAISTQAGSLHDAARVGDLQKLEQSLSDGAFVNAWDENPGMATIHPISLQSAIQAEQQAEAALSRAKDSSHDAEAVRAAEEALEQAWKYRRIVELSILRIKRRWMGGSVNAMQGDVYIRTDVGDLKIENDFKLYQGDKIISGNDAYLEIMFNNPAKISMGAASFFTITSVHHGFSFALTKGFFKVKTWKQIKGDVRVRTADASIAAHVAEFEVEAVSTGMTITVHSGEVEITPDGGKATMVHAGGRFHVDPDGRNKLERMGGGISLLAPDEGTTLMRGVI